MWRARFFKTLPKIIEEYPTHRFIFLTLTVKNCPLTELRETLRHMNKSWQRLSELKRFPAIGWVKSVEVTRGQDGLAHPHFHCLLMVPPSYFGKNYIKQEEWTELWRRSLRVDYTPIVNVKAVKSKKVGQPELVKDVLADALVAGILETLKYAIKPDDLVFSPEWLAELTNQLHKTRAISVGGVLREFISDEEPEDLIHGEDEIELTPQEAEVWFGWRENSKRYVKTERV
jgi:plasmid rolling circle replication initiator protein Rep